MKLKIVLILSLFLLATPRTLSQTKLLRGEIVDKDSKQGIAGVHIYSTSNHRRGSVSNADGMFAVRILPGRSLVFSHIGYSTVIKTIENSSDTLLRIEMVPLTQQLGDVVITAKQLTANEIMQEVFKNMDKNHKVEPVYFDFYSRLINFKKDSSLNSLEEFTGTLFHNKASQTRYHFEKVRFGAFSVKAKKEIDKQRVVASDKMKIDNLFKYTEDYLHKKKSKRYTYAVLDEVELLGRACYVISFSTERFTHYSRGRLFIDMEDFAVARKTLEKEDGTFLTDVSFIRLKDQWYLKKAIDNHSDKGGDIASRVTLYNVQFDTNLVPKEGYTKLTPIDFIKDFIGDFNDSYWLDKNFIPLPNWVKNQIK